MEISCESTSRVIYSKMQKMPTFHTLIYRLNQSKLPFFNIKKNEPMIKGVRTEIAINQKYQRGTFERSINSDISEITNMNKAIEAKVSVISVAIWSFQSHKTV